MKVLNVSIYEHNQTKPVRLASVMDDREIAGNLISRLYSTNIKETIDFSTRLIVSRTALGTAQTVAIDGIDFVSHVRVAKRGAHVFGAVIVTSDDYSKSIAYTTLTKIIDAYTMNTNVGIIASEDVKGSQLTPPWLVAILNSSKNPEDKIAQVLNQVDDVKDIMTKNIEDILGRGEKLDDLLARTNELSEKSKGLARDAHKMARRCPMCTLL